MLSNKENKQRLLIWFRVWKDRDDTLGWHPIKIPDFFAEGDEKIF